jgi:hypothetical protein
MAIDTGDLSPRASGSASLGVEQLGICGFTTDIRPFCHVHQNSGVFHSPLGGNSGVIRYEQGDFEISSDGGTIFRRLVRTLDDAYQGGAIVDSNLGSDNTYEPVILVGKNGSDKLEFGTNPVLDLPETNPMILLSGVGPQADDTLFRKPALGLALNGIALRGSGTPSVEPSTWAIGVDSATPGQISQTSSGVMNIFSAGPIIYQGTSNFAISAGTNFNAVANGDVGFSATNGDVSFFATGNVEFSALGGNGLLEWVEGAHDAWHTSNSRNDNTLIPIPHSGHVEQMIAAAAPASATMQSVYEENPLRILDDGDLISISNTGKHKFSTFESRAEINLSGILESVPSSDLEQGDITMLSHAGAQGLSLPIASQAIANARSLGPGHLQLNTGSGIAQIPVASGLNQFTGGPSPQALATFPTYTQINISTPSITRDDFMTWIPASTGVRVNVPGIYQVIGKLTLLGAGTASAFCRLTINGTAVAGAGSADIVINAFFTTTHVSTIVRCNAGDILRLEGTVTAAGAASTLANSSDLMIEYKGPRR